MLGGGTGSRRRDTRRGAMIGRLVVPLSLLFRACLSCLHAVAAWRVALLLHCLLPFGFRDRCGAVLCLAEFASAFRPAFTGSDQAYRRISTGRLNALPRLHPRPIDVVVCHAPHSRPGFEGGFPLRCLQRLSCPDIATLLRGWRHDRSTSGPSTPVLSY